MVLKRSRWPKPDIERALVELNVSDDELRGNAVRAFCPCRAGWPDFEKYVDRVIRGLRDPSRYVRKNALHVFEDAVRLQASADLQYYIEDGEDKPGEKRACARYRSMERRLEARRERRNRRHSKHSNESTRLNPNWNYTLET
jgi:hypothetical protein